MQTPKYRLAEMHEFLLPFYWLW